MIKESNVTVMVSDLNRAIQFYTETLGLKLVNRVQDHWAEVAAPGLTIGLHPAGPHGPKPGNSESLAIGFTVDNLDNDITTFKNKGIAFAPNRFSLTIQIRILFTFAKYAKIQNKVPSFE